MSCKMSVVDSTISKPGSTYTICAMSRINVRCSGDDTEKKQCPFWNNMTGEKQ